jgi:hypothetical protein
MSPIPLVYSFDPGVPVRPPILSNFCFNASPTTSMSFGNVVKLAIRYMTFPSTRECTLTAVLDRSFSNASRSPAAALEVYPALVSISEHTKPLEKADTYQNPPHP